MAIDDFIKGGLNASQPSVPTTAARSVTPKKEEPKEDVSTFKDVAMAIPRGVEGAVQSTYDLIDFLAMDALPDYDKRFLGRSQTTAGGFVEGAAQFLTGFVPIAGALGKVGRVAQLSKKLDKPIATALARGKQLNPKQLRALSKQKDKVKKGAGLVARGAVADFVAFDAQEQRLSNLIEQYPTLQNPVTEFLAAKDDDGEIEGRLKNVVEGLFIEAGVGGAIEAAKAFVKSTKLIKARQENLRKGMSVEEATEDAISKSEDFSEDILNSPDKLYSRDIPWWEWDDLIEGGGAKAEVVEESTSTLTPRGGARQVEGKAQQRAAGLEYNSIEGKKEGAGKLGVEDAPRVEGDAEKSDAIPQMLLKEEVTTTRGLKFKTYWKRVTNALNEDVVNQRPMAKAHIDFITDLQKRFPKEMGSLDVQTKTDRASYNPRNHKIKISTDEELETVTHELIHAVTARKVNDFLGESAGYKPDELLGGQRRTTRGTEYHENLRKIQAKATERGFYEDPVEELIDLYYKAAEALEITPRVEDTLGVADMTSIKGVEYGFGNLDEFMTQVFSSNKFREELASIEIQPTGGVLSNAFEAIKEAIYKMLGYDKDRPNTILDEMFRVTDEVAQSQEGSLNVSRYQDSAKQRGLTDTVNTPKAEPSPLLPKIDNVDEVLKVTKPFKQLRLTIGESKTKRDVWVGEVGGVEYRVWRPRDNQGRLTKYFQVKPADGDGVFTIYTRNKTPKIEEIEAEVMEYALAKAGGKEPYLSRYSAGGELQSISDVETNYAPRKPEGEPARAARVSVKEKFRTESVELGGEQAVKSAVRNITSSEDVSELANVVAETMLKEGEIPKTTFEELITETKADMEVFGDRGEARVAAIEQLAKSGGDLTRVLTEQRAIKRIQGALGKELQTAATNLKDMKGRVGEDVARTEMYRLLDQFVEVQRIWGIYGRNLSLPFLQRKAIYKNGVSAPRDLGVGVKDANGNVDISNLTKEQITQFSDSIRGSQNEDKLVEAIARITSTDDMDKVLKGLNKIADGTKGRAGFDMANEWYINSLLSGITTQMVNIGGSVITNFMRSVEQSVGYAINGDFKAAGAVIKYAYDMEAIRESFHLAAQAFNLEEGVTFKHRRVYDDRPNTGAIRAERFGVDPESTLGQGMEWLFKNVVRLPSRGLTAGDEFFKAMNYRTFIKTQLHMDGMKKGIKGEDLDKYVQKSYQDYLVANRAAFSEEAVTREALKLAREKNLTFEKKDEFVETYIRENYYDKIADKEAGVDLELAKKGREWSLINTHTQDNGFMVDEINAVVRKIPALQLVIPFVRTPMNILQFAWERTAFGVAKDTVQGITGKNQALKRMSQEMYSKLDRGSAQERAEIHGKMAMGTGLTGLGIYMMMFMEDDEQFSVTGFGARNKAQREAWMMAGNQPYSIRIGDKNYQYSRLDPIATTLGIFADLRDVMNNRYGEVDEEGVNKVLGALALTFANNLTNKSYVQGLDNLFSVMKEPLKSSERLAGNIAGGFFVPSFVNQMQNFEEDRLLRETRGLMDYVLKRSPSGSQDLPPKRNFLGEAVSMENKGGVAGFLDPIYSKNVSFDALNNEIASMNHAFSLPQAKMGDIDLRQTKNAEGVEAYDRFLELSSTMQINGRTMRQALNGLIGSYEYNAMASQEQASENGVESPRIKEINRIVGAYRSLARSQMLQEFPELQAELMGKKVARRQAQAANQ